MDSDGENEQCGAGSEKFLVRAPLSGLQWECDVEKSFDGHQDGQPETDSILYM